ncbi:mediator of RNA polymerase II transcription subunit 4-like [Liolophura sinensis]|uniref:mediator of RNA polymerase II transcription subunit 4-like n=1 Tax=Liolophura sinensis TaxID=3198878 RepID=UPI0031582566
MAAVAGDVVSTRHKLLSLIDDVEIATKELLEVMSAPKGQQRSDQPDTVMLMDLLIHKDKEIKETLKLAEEQGNIQKTIDELKAEVDKRDHDIKNLQKNLKEAETILGTAVYQAKQKLNAINQANKRTISSEDLIKFAHRISADNSVAAPSTWSLGDPRRPYPTDFEMRSGFLGKINDLPISSVHTQISYSDALGPTRPPQVEQIPTSQNTSSVSWQPPMEVTHSLTSSSTNTHHHQNTHESSLKGHNKENEDVEYMSSESSSSSSSDE